MKKPANVALRMAVVMILLPSGLSRRCYNNDNCGEGKVCNTQGGNCVECLEHTHCSATQYCHANYDCFNCSYCSRLNDAIGGNCPQRCYAALCSQLQTCQVSSDCSSDRCDTHPRCPNARHCRCNTHQQCHGEYHHQTPPHSSPTSSQGAARSLIGACCALRTMTVTRASTAGMVADACSAVRTATARTGTVLTDSVTAGVGTATGVGSMR